MSQARYYQTRYSLSKKRKVVWKEITRYLQKFIPPNAKVLDLGAGYGDFINSVKAKEKYALDMVDTRRFMNQDVCFYKFNILTEFEKFKEKGFDVVFASNFLEHFSSNDRKKLFSKIKKVLKSSGRLILLQPNYFYCYKVYFDDYDHKTIYTHQNISDILKLENFEIAKIIPKFLPFTLKESKLPVTKYLIRFYLNSPIKPLAGQMLVIAQLKT